MAGLRRTIAGGEATGSKEAEALQALASKVSAKVAAGEVLVPWATVGVDEGGKHVEFDSKSWYGYLSSLAWDVSPSCFAFYVARAEVAVRWARVSWFVFLHVALLYVTLGVIAIAMRPELLALLALRVLRSIPAYCNYAVGRIGQSLLDEITDTFAAVIGGPTAAGTDIALRGGRINLERQPGDADPWGSPL